MKHASDPVRAALKPLWAQWDDDKVTELLFNGGSEIWADREGKRSKVGTKFGQEALATLVRALAKRAGRPADDPASTFEVVLDEGAHAWVVLPPAAPEGPVVRLRKPLAAAVGLGQLLQQQVLTPAIARFLEAAVALRLNILVCGEAASGKAELLAALASLSPKGERTAVISERDWEGEVSPQLIPFRLSARSEDPDETQFEQRLQSARALEVDRLILPELAPAHAFPLVEAVNTGQNGVLAGVHSPSPTVALRRLEAFCLGRSGRLPPASVRARVACAFDLIVTCGRNIDGRSRIARVSETLSLSRRMDFRVRDIFVYSLYRPSPHQPASGYHAPTGILPQFIARARQEGFDDLDERLFDPASYRVPAPVMFDTGEDAPESVPAAVTEERSPRPNREATPSSSLPFRSASASLPFPELPPDAPERMEEAVAKALAEARNRDAPANEPTQVIPEEVLLRAAKSIGAKRIGEQITKVGPSPRQE